MDEQSEQNAVLFEAGLALYSQGNILEALCSFLEAAGNAPQDPQSHYLSGLAMQALGLEDEAQAEWREVLLLTRHQAARARTIGDGADPDPRRRWVNDMAQRLLQRGQV